MNRTAPSECCPAYVDQDFKASGQHRTAAPFKRSNVEFHFISVKIRRLQKIVRQISTVPYGSTIGGGGGDVTILSLFWEEMARK